MHISSEINHSNCRRWIRLWFARCV